MRYENVLQIYWVKGYFFGGHFFSFEKSLSEMLYYLQGFNWFFFKKIVERFELTFFLLNRQECLVDFFKYNTKVLTLPLNIIFSQINSVNNRRYDLYKLNIIRLYLIKSYRGRCHALGKPVRGQRTWSNAWNSFNLNKTLRLYISETKNQLKSKLLPEKINYKVLEKKYAKKTKTKKPKQKEKKVIWF